MMHSLNRVYSSMPAILVCALWLEFIRPGAPSPDAKRLYDDLMKKRRYNKLIRPVGNTTDKLTVWIGLRLTQILDVDEKNQIVTTNVWLDQEWQDFRFVWKPKEYGGIRKLYVPSDEIWIPDIVLYNSADGNFTVKHKTKATVTHRGHILWRPPAIYKSLCPINVEYFPFDEQRCTLKVGSWTYDGYSVDIKHKKLKSDIKVSEFDVVEHGIDLDEYHRSTEWDLLEVPAQKYEKFYPCCSEPYPDIKFNMTIRRKTLFHTVNLILPCVAICSVTLLVFYIPVNSGEKITMGITILNSLNIFLLLVAEINPPTSLATPLIGKYLLFTMALVMCSVVVTVFVLNIHFRSPSTHVMSPLVRKLFLRVLPPLLLMRRPQTKKQLFRESIRYSDELELAELFQEDKPLVERDDIMPLSAEMQGKTTFSNLITEDVEASHSKGDAGYAGPSSRKNTAHRTLPPGVVQAMIGVSFIAENIKRKDEFNQIKDDWHFVAMVLDRFFLWVFSATCIVGTLGIIIQAPTLYDNRVPLGEKGS